VLNHPVGGPNGSRDPVRVPQQGCRIICVSLPAGTPELPSVPGVEVPAHFRPHLRREVGQEGALEERALVAPVDPLYLAEETLGVADGRPFIQRVCHSS
jgi:hypothetical protein